MASARPRPRRRCRRRPTRRPSRRRDRARVTTIPEQVTDLRDLVIAYVKQETVDAAQGRSAASSAFGVAGSLLLGSA